MNDASSLTTTMKLARERLAQRFASLKIEAPTVPYPAHKTVEEGKLLRGAMRGTFTKNLLLKDKKNHLFLLAIHEDRSIDLKRLHRLVGGKGQLSFASAETMIELLGVAPGALTPLGLINDTQGTVTAVIDASLMQAEQVNFHPLINTESTGLRPLDLLNFIRSCGREPVLIDFESEEESPAVNTGR
jgi:Ala-tRNA(Pro) deacylase